MGGGVASLLAACQSAPARPVPTPVNPLIKPKPEGNGVVALQASSELAVGRNRFALGLVDARNQPMTSGTVQVEFFKLKADGTGEKRAESPALFRSVGGQSKGVWVAPAEFGEAGSWGAQVNLVQPNAAPLIARMNFDVRDRFSAPGYGEPAVRSTSLTAKDVGGDLSHICTNQPPCELHSISIADALAPGQKPLLAKYPFDGQHVAKAVDEWHLPSDPWTFVIDRGGIVRDRFEGVAPAEELEPALKAVLT